MQITAVILAGGRGMRMGGIDKGLVDYQGKAMVAQVLQRIRPQVDQVIINANRNLATYQQYGVTVVADATDQFDGPLAGFQAGAAHAATDWILTVPCDSPLLPLDLVARLSQAVQVTNTLVAVARSVSGEHPVFCLFHHSLKADLTAFLSEGQRRVSGWQARHSPVFVTFEDEQAFTNINHAQQC
ncbi:molybdenum cofactor guanylyltransferase MobA [Methylophilus luteus]|uniref:Molybdenum cofactor guanylyltransferase n=1 Tax=Methylophilus luteus TaxID=640108 RepID=A0ABW3F851_9PROT